jgi:hypothetical protein
MLLLIIIIESYFYRNTSMLASGIRGIRVQLRDGSDRLSTLFMRRRLGCLVCLLRGAPPPFHSVSAEILMIQDEGSCPKNEEMLCISVLFIGCETCSTFHRSRSRLNYFLTTILCEIK